MVCSSPSRVNIILAGLVNEQEITKNGSVGRSVYFWGFLYETLNMHCLRSVNFRK